MTALLDLPGVTYSRIGAATAWRADGTLAEFAANVPRITDAGITIEGQRTNLFPRWDPTTAQFSSRVGCSDVAAPAVAPLTGRNWIALDNTSASSNAYQTVTLSPLTQYTAQVLVATSDGSQPTAGVSTTSGDFSFNLGNLIAGAVITYRRLSQNVWSVTATLTSSASPGSSSGIVRYATQNTRPLKFSGFQLEQASTPSTQIITTGAAATVGPDNLAFAKPVAAGEDFTAFCEVELLAAPNDGISHRLFEFNDGTASNRANVIQSNGNIYAVATIAGVGSPPIGTLAAAGVGRKKFALRRSGNVVTFAAVGVVRGSSAPLTGAPSLSTMWIGSTSGASAIDAPVRSTIIFPFALTDAQLVEITK